MVQINWTLQAKGDLMEFATFEESSVIQQEDKRQVERKVKLYNLNVITSVGNLLI